MPASPCHSSQALDDLWEELCSPIDDVPTNALLVDTDENSAALNDGMCHSLDDLLDFGSFKTNDTSCANPR